MALRLHHDDNVGLNVAQSMGREAGDPPVPKGHKVALTDIPEDAPVRKYGQVIGYASRPIREGDHVHTHNLRFDAVALDYAFASEARETAMVPPEERATFQGIVRADGRVATRNYIGILTSVNCSATVAKLVAQHVQRSGLLDDYPNVDGVMAVTHGTGCGMAGEGEGFEILRRTLTGYAHHPNFAGVLVIGLGCEVNQISDLTKGWDLGPQRPTGTMTIQEQGGTSATVRAAMDELRAMLPVADAVHREPVPASELVLGLECGGSDAYSGITANPALGAAADQLVHHGGTAILAETPEVYGAEHLLTRRAVSREVGERLVDRIHWWERYTEMFGGSMDNNPSPGNKEGGLTTILEKSLGAVAKGGTTNLVDVYRYAEPVTAKGFVFMDTPGYDPVSVTGMVAGGANVVCFTTGRGSVFGCTPTPSLKLCTNSDTYRHMADDMDVNCGVITDGEADVEKVGQRIFDLILATASGQPSKSEELGFGEEEFTPWQLGAVM
ncbi:MAG: UxaA family hydrolase [Streptosporangiaceae bacterium]